MSVSFSTRNAYGEIIRDLAEQDSRIVILDADLSEAVKTTAFHKDFPKRSINVGISEQDMISTAAGISTLGYIPFASTFAVFASLRAADQVRNTVAYNEMNVKIVGTHSGLNVGEDGGSHQALEDIAVMRSIPHMTIFAPCDGEETKEAIKAALKITGPVYIRLGRDVFPNINKADNNFVPGKTYLIRPGNDAVVFAHGLMVSESLKAADVLSKQGISFAVVNVPTLKPLESEEILKHVKGKKAVLTLEEHNIFGGLGSITAEILAENMLSGIKFRRLGVKDSFGESGTTDALLHKYHLTGEDTAKTVKEILN